MPIEKTVPETWYSEWFNSIYYDMLYAHRDDKEAAAFIDRLFSQLNPDVHSLIADIPCGNGRHARHIASKGYRVTGYDLSEKNIAYARRFESDQVHFAQHNMTLPFGANLFDFILNLFTSLGYFRSTHTDLRILKNFYAALKSGGKLVIDYFNATHVLKHLVSKHTCTVNDVQFTIEKEIRDLQIIKHIQVNDSGKTLYFAERVWLYSPSDFEHMLHEAGFKLNHLYGDYLLNDFDENESPRLIMIAQK